MEKDRQTSVATTSRNLLTIYKPDVLSRQLADVRGVDDALSLALTCREQFPSIAVLKKDYGAQKVETVIKLYLVELCELVNLKRPLTEKQIDMIAMDVVRRFFSLTIADVHVIFTKARAGEFGELYESMDMPKVMRWFIDYFDARCDAAAMMSEREAERMYDKGGNMTSERARKHFDELEKQFKTKTYGKDKG